MIYGYLPFDDKDNNILFRKILECKLEFPQDLYASDEVKDLISRIKHQGVYSYNELFSILEKITMERNQILL